MANKMMGIGASAGVAVAKVYILDEQPIVIPQDTAKDVTAELANVSQAITKAKADLENLQKIAQEN
nr:phosphoenolpyruvate-utilizing N-terminal domain-containing protein [Spiroplasma clarkii]